MREREREREIRGFRRTTSRSRIFMQIHIFMNAAGETLAEFECV